VQALRNQEITIYGDGSQTRSFCYVDDLIDGFVRLFESNQMGPINLGNPVEFTMLELAEQVLALTSSNSRLRFEALPADDPRQRQPDIAMAKSELAWSPIVQLKEGLERTVEYFKKVI
jgi:UDP-glucuronate decarboxylase